MYLIGFRSGEGCCPRAEGGDAAIPLKARWNRVSARTGEVARRPRATAGEWGHGSPLQCLFSSSRPEGVSMYRRSTWAPLVLDRHAGRAHRVS